MGRDVTAMGQHVTDVGHESKESKKELKKHAATIHCSNTLSLLQRKISNALLYHAYKELMLKEDDSESSSDGSLSQSPKFGQRQYSQRGTVLKKPIDVQDSMGDIMEELDNQKQPNALQQILEAKSEESSQEIAKK